ncbi:hypothetical protein [Nitrogeniibacter aestuarii]|uniref:hypothetical protein n=1 Tax=Nitrogeniibacter aestuarii TaxID=2815343 RepID=UPI001D102E4C|nr:hypothetical protein [Nitrogeniibacter aestuarii]
MRKRMRRALGVLLLLAATGVHAGKADVLDAQAQCDAQRQCTLSVTVRHADSGWDHYANAWIVRTPDGTVLATRALLHPHVSEQPFTRSLPGVVIPPGIETVIIEAVDSVHGSGGTQFTLPID